MLVKLEGEYGLCSDKSAIRSFARTWATDLKARKIRVNAVIRGPIEVASLRDLLGSSLDGQKGEEGFAQMVPVDRLGSQRRLRKQSFSSLQQTVAMSR